MSSSNANERQARTLRRRNEIEPRTLFEAGAQAGAGELTRPASSLFLSSIAAGLAMCASLVVMGALYQGVSPSPATHVIVSLGYPFGFILISIGRLQLYTESTLSAILPVARHGSWQATRLVLRLWGIVLAGNVIGGVVIGAALPLLLPADLAGAVEDAVHHILDRPALAQLFAAMPSGFLIGLIAWALPAMSAERVLAVGLVTFVIGAGSFPHIVAGTIELAVLVQAGEVTILRAIGQFWLPVLIGNTLGGAALFAGLAYGQVRDEIKGKPPEVQAEDLTGGDGDETEKKTGD